MTKRYYLRIEGVNLLNFVYDTQDLSTIRGGGLSLLDSVEEIKDKFHGQLSAISTGASFGLFKMNVSTSGDAEKIKNEVENYINEDDCLKHATFVVDILESDGDFVVDREKLIAFNHWRQMQSPSVAVPSKSSEKPCRIDMVRPGVKEIPYKGENDVPVSESVYHRRNYGIEMKQKFYENATGIKLKFVHKLDELTSDTSRGNLHHKMAVIYIDGNSFGKIQQDAETPSDLNSWDGTIKDYRKTMLCDLLTAIKGKSEWMNGDAYRIETLLWGGDELIWVVPAWVGWWTLKFFYEKSQHWEFDKETLKHAAGIVFCHHNAPIHRITALAKDLAELAKNKDRDESLFVYQVLESFDHIGKDISTYVQYIYNGEIESSDLVLEGEMMDEIAEHIRTLKKNDFPRSRLHGIIQSILAKQDDVNTLVDRGLGKSDSKEDLKGSLDILEIVLNGERAKWIHIAELWDYIT